MAVLVNAVAFFTAAVLGTRIKLDILATHLPGASKRLFGIPDFRLYALASVSCSQDARYSTPTPRPSLHSPSVEVFGESPAWLYF